MGVDATVYVGRDRLPPGARIDEQTGEGCLNDKAFIAATKRLGNAAAIAFLGEQVRETGMQADSILLAKILFSGSHSGDLIKLDELSALRNEIQQVRSRTDGHRTEELEQFLLDLQELAMVAEENRNPIVFV